jgi:hypothetical protein
MPKINISTQAYEFLRRRVAKKALQMAALPENELRKNDREVKHWDLIDRKLNNSKPSLTSDMMMMIELKRVELKSLQVMVLDTMVALNSKTIPEYQKRMTEIPNKTEFYKGYVDKAEALYMGLAELLQAINDNMENK